MSTIQQNFTSRPVLLFRGDGVSEALSGHVHAKITQLFQNSVLTNIDHSYLSQPSLQKSILLIGGGNASKQYKGLRETGVENIKNYLKSDNHYLGICAGAYLGTRYLLNVVEAHYNASTASEVSKYTPNWKKVRTIKSQFSELNEMHVLYWKGPEFQTNSYGWNERSLVTYENQSPAVVFKGGASSRALLVSYHPEINLAALDSSFFDGNEDKQLMIDQLEESQHKVDQLTKLLFLNLDFMVK